MTREIERERERSDRELSRVSTTLDRGVDRCCPRPTLSRCRHNLYSSRVHTSAAEQQNRSNGLDWLAIRSVVTANANISTLGYWRAGGAARTGLVGQGSWRQSSHCRCCNGSAKQYCSVTAACVRVCGRRSHGLSRAGDRPTYSHPTASSAN